MNWPAIMTLRRPLPIRAITLRAKAAQMQRQRTTMRTPPRMMAPANTRVAQSRERAIMTPMSMCLTLLPVNSHLTATIAPGLACLIPMEMGYAMNLRPEDAPMLAPVTTRLMPQATTAPAPTLMPATIALATACSMTTATACVIKMK